MESKQLTQLGAKVGAATTPGESVLETIPIPLASYVNKSVVRFSCPEFTSLCPVTGQPDFAHIYIDIIPQGLQVESKSLKLFLQSFRNHGAFHEDCTCYIADRLVQALHPKWLRVSGIWFPRGGIPIDVFFQTDIPPAWAHIPPIQIDTFRGR